jgi:hypothetical protein
MEETVTVVVEEKPKKKATKRRLQRSHPLLFLM